VVYNISMCAVCAYHWNAFVQIEGRPVNSNHENRMHVDWIGTFLITKT